MQIDLNMKEKTIIIWLARNEATPNMKEIVGAHPGYRITLMRSGNSDITSLTSQLLTVNR